MCYNKGKICDGPKEMFSLLALVFSRPASVFQSYGREAGRLLSAIVECSAFLVKPEVSISASQILLCALNTHIKAVFLQGSAGRPAEGL